MANGYVVKDGLIVAVVYGFTGQLEVGETFIEESNIRNSAGDPAPVKYVPVHVVRERLEAAGKWDDMVAILMAPENQSLFVKMVTLETGIDPADPVAITMIQAVGEDPALVLDPTS